MRHTLPLHHATDEHHVKSYRPLFLKVNLLGLIMTQIAILSPILLDRTHKKKQLLALYQSSKVMPSSLSRISLMAAEESLVVFEGLSENHGYGKL